MGQGKQSDPLSVAIAERNMSMRQAIKGLLHREPDIELVGHAHDHGGVLRMLHLCEPRVLLLDPRALDPHGVLALPSVCEVSPGTAVVVTDFPSWSGYEKTLRKLGAAGFVSKLAPPESWLAAIRAAARAQPGP